MGKDSENGVTLFDGWINLEDQLWCVFQVEITVDLLLYFMPVVTQDAQNMWSFILMIPDGNHDTCMLQAATHDDTNHGDGGVVHLVFRNEAKNGFAYFAFNDFIEACNPIDRHDAAPADRSQRLLDFFMEIKFKNIPDIEIHILVQPETAFLAFPDFSALILKPA